METAGGIIDRNCRVDSQFSAIAENICLRMITQDTLDTIQGRIDENIESWR